MLQSIEDILAPALHRTLESEPKLELEAAASRVVQAARAAGLTAFDDTSLRSRIEALGRRFRRQAVLNPLWLSQQKLGAHFWLVNAQPGWLEHLVSQTREQRDGISQYILYGDWDSLIVLRGTESEAEVLKRVIEGSAYLRPVSFTATSTLLFYGYEPRALPSAVPQATAAVIGRLVEDYDNGELAQARYALVDKGILLGPTWVSQAPAYQRIVAFVGLSVRGRHNVQGSEMLAALRSHEILRNCLVHLFQTEGQPFDYFAKVVCGDMLELDEATNLIAYTRVGTARIEAVTLVVARGTDQLPRFRPAATSGLIPTPDIRELETIARETLVRLGTEAVQLFNSLSPSEKLLVLRSLEELEREVSRRQWDDERDKLIKSAVSAFATAALAPLELARITGAVVAIGTAVEGQLKNVVRLAAESAFGKDYARIQNELRLPSKNLRLLTLGKSLAALKSIREHPVLQYLADALDDESLSRLNHFSEIRNRWAHSSVPSELTREQAVDEAHRALVEGIGLIRWVHARLLPLIREHSPVLEDRSVALPETRGERSFGIFVSHSREDRQLAERIANALLALGYPVWYADWSIEPGDSIVERIEEGLAKNDTLMILLTVHSVASLWVRRELNTALMAQLSGQDVTIVPVLLDKTEVPATLSGVKYVELSSSDFEEGFLKLLEFLRKKRRKLTGEVPALPRQP